jgi:hypothetical protein
MAALNWGAFSLSKKEFSIKESISFHKEILSL